MKRLLTISLLIFLMADLLSARVRVRGYYRKNGTYVQPHYRTNPDGNPYNNYSFPGNYNPNTGEISKGNPDTYLKNYNKPSKSSSYQYSEPVVIEKPPLYPVTDNSSILQQTSNTINVGIVDIPKSEIYYIILCSESSMAAAEESVENFKNRTILESDDFKILPTMVNGKQWYRVAIGKYETYNSARMRMNCISVYIPSGTWVQKY